MKATTLPALALLLAMAPAFVGESAAAAERPSVTVADFTNRSDGAGWWSDELGRRLADAVADELVATGRFEVLEGQLPGRYLVTGVVSTYSDNGGGNGAGVWLGPIHVGGNRREAYVQIELRVLDTATSRIVHVHKAEGRSSATGLQLTGYAGRGISGSFSHAASPQADKAMRAALADAIGYLDCVMARRDRCLARYRS